MKVKGNKKGFTLLEVMLAIAILLIASTMVMQGFLSTITYSFNSAVYAMDGARNSSSVNKDMSDAASSEDFLAPSGGKELKLSIGSGESAKSQTFSVMTWSSALHGSQDMKAAYAENGSAVSNRYSLGYTLPAAFKCPKCKSSAYLAKEEDTEKWFCNRSACGYAYCVDTNAPETTESSAS